MSTAEDLKDNPDEAVTEAMATAQERATESGSTFRQDLYQEDGSVLIVRSVGGDDATLQAAESVEGAEAVQ